MLWTPGWQATAASTCCPVAQAPGCAQWGGEPGKPCCCGAAAPLSAAVPWTYTKRRTRVNRVVTTFSSARVHSHVVCRHNPVACSTLRAARDYGCLRGWQHFADPHPCMDRLYA